MSVAEAQEKIDAREFAGWIAYNRIEPFGEDRADLRTAIVACTVANANRGKGTQPFRPRDFMPDFSQKPAQTADEMQTRLFQFADIHNQRLKK